MPTFRSYIGVTFWLGQLLFLVWVNNYFWSGSKYHPWIGAAMEECASHKTLMQDVSEVKTNLDILRQDMAEVKLALIGDLYNPGWLTKLVETQKQVAVLTRAAWGIIVFIGVAIGGAALNMLLK